MRIAIYDLDRTITRWATYTPFLVFAAARLSGWRVLLFPFWLIMMGVYAAGLVDRKTLKEQGFRLMIGDKADSQSMKEVASAFARFICRHNIHAAALARIQSDRAAGSTLLMATAAPEFYARAISEILGFDDLVATQHARDENGDYYANIVGQNCYGPHKLAMIEQWMKRKGFNATGIDKYFYSDSRSDAPVLSWADRAFVVNASDALQGLAKRRGWETLSFN